MQHNMCNGFKEGEGNRAAVILFTQDGNVHGVLVFLGGCVQGESCGKSAERQKVTDEGKEEMCHGYDAYSEIY